MYWPSYDRKINIIPINILYKLFHNFPAIKSILINLYHIIVTDTWYILSIYYIIIHENFHKINDFCRSNA